MTQLHTLGIDEIVTGLGNKTFSSLELTEHLLARIDSHDKNINSFITLSADLAKNKPAKPIPCVPVAMSVPCLAYRWHTKTIYVPKAY